jgi:hypothetical protein
MIPYSGKIIYATDLDEFENLEKIKARSTIVIELEEDNV